MYDVCVLGKRRRVPLCAALLVGQKRAAAEKAVLQGKVTLDPSQPVVQQGDLTMYTDVSSAFHCAPVDLG